MLTPTATLLNRLDAQRNMVLALARPLEEAALRARPHPDGWSILDILEHLVVAESVILRGLPPWQELVPQPRTPGQRLKFLLVWLVLAGRIPVKVPSRRMLPTGQLGLEQIIGQWDAHQSWLRIFLSEAGADADRLALFSHPVAGPITLRQALRLDLLHLQTHQRQIARQLRGSPPSREPLTEDHP